MRSRGGHAELVLLNDAGQEMLLQAFTGRARPRSSYPDFVDAYLRALRDAGVLDQFEEPGVDPLAVIKNVIEVGLERAIALQQESFRWPTTDAPAGLGQVGEISWPKIGLLRHLGYKVGAAGGADRARRRILDRAYQNVVPQVTSKAYMREWGAPATGPRLRKMADCIASFVKLAKRREDSSAMDAAIADWEADLGYLRRTHYDGRYDFPWPATTSRRRA